MEIKMTLQKQFFLLISFLGLFPFWQGHAAQPKQDLSIWPQAESGYKRFVIKLPTLKNETEAKIEIIPQKKIKVDCNITALQGNMQTKTIQGWGYDYYRLDKVGLPVSTLMACPKNTVQEKFVDVSTNLSLIRYNSKLPIVVYIPKDLHLSYRVWMAKPLQTAKEK